MSDTLLQYVFNRVVIHQLAQGKRCTVKGKPVIRNGVLADPVGALVVNTVEANERGSVRVEECEDLLKKSGLKLGDVGPLLDELQAIHDLTPNGEWEEQFRALAAEQDLVYPEAAAEQAQLARKTWRSSFAKKAWATRRAKPKAAGHKARATALVG